VFDGACGCRRVTIGSLRERSSRGLTLRAKCLDLDCQLVTAPVSACGKRPRRVGQAVQRGREHPADITRAEPAPGTAPRRDDTIVGSDLSRDPDQTRGPPLGGGCRREGRRWLSGKGDGGIVKAVRLFTREILCAS